MHLFINGWPWSSRFYPKRKRESIPVPSISIHSQSLTTCSPLKNGWLEYFLVSFWGANGLVSGVNLLLVSGRGTICGLQLGNLDFHTLKKENGTPQGIGDEPNLEIIILRFHSWWESKVPRYPPPKLPPPINKALKRPYKGLSSWGGWPWGGVP